MDWYKNPVILIVAGVGVFAAYILMKNQGGPASTPNQFQTTNVPTNTVNPSTTSSGLNPVGGSYSYLDGSGMQHIIATDPYGNLMGYSNLPPDTSQPQPNQLSSYVGSMSGQYLVSPYGSTTPNYSTMPWNMQTQ